MRRRPPGRYLSAAVRDPQTPPPLAGSVENPLTEPEAGGSVQKPLPGKPGVLFLNTGMNFWSTYFVFKRSSKANTESYECIRIS